MPGTISKDGKKVATPIIDKNGVSRVVYKSIEPREVAPRRCPEGQMFSHFAQKCVERRKPFPKGQRRNKDGICY